MAELKDAWKQTAKSAILMFNDLSISLYKTAKAGVDAAVTWARKDNPHVQAEGTEVPDSEPAAEPVQDKSAADEPADV